MPLKTIVSFDIEATGPCPPRWSMISLGAVAFRVADSQELARFAVNLKELPGSERDPGTMAWWSGFPDAWKEATVNPREPGEAMRKFAGFLQQFRGARLLAAPVAYDGMWLRWYLETFCPQPGDKVPPWHNMMDVRSALWAATGEYAGNWRKIVTRITGKQPPQRPKSQRHLAVHDAWQQGKYFLMLADWLRETGRQMPPG